MGFRDSFSSVDGLYAVEESTSMNTFAKLQVFCPVDPTQLESTTTGMICRKCQENLVDVSRPCQAKKLAQGVCGVMWQIVGPVVGSTIALSSCSLDGSSAASEDSIQRQNQAKQGTSGTSGVPLPGSYFYPGGETYDPKDYPVAEISVEPGMVISPYSQTKVDVTRHTEGTLVLILPTKWSIKSFSVFRSESS